MYTDEKHTTLENLLNGPSAVHMGFKELYRPMHVRDFLFGDIGPLTFLFVFTWLVLQPHSTCF